MKVELVCHYDGRLTEDFLREAMRTFERIGEPSEMRVKASEWWRAIRAESRVEIPPDPLRIHRFVNDAHVCPVFFGQKRGTVRIVGEHL